VWPAAEGYTVLHSGKPAPTDGEVFTRRESAGIVLDNKVTATWRAAREVWRSVIYRVIMATLKWTNKWRQRSGKTFVTFICAYAPTAWDTPDVKCQFLEQLQVSLYNVPQDIPL